MDDWFNRPESEEEAGLEEVTRRELYGYNETAQDSLGFDSYDEYDGTLAPSGSLVTPEEVEANAVDDEDVRRMREWNQENRL